MEKKIIYLIETIISILVSLAALIKSAVSFIPGANNVSNICIIVFSSLFLVASIIYIIELIRRDVISTKVSNIALLSMMSLTVVCFILMMIDFKVLYFILFAIEFALTLIYKTVSMINTDVKIRYNHVRRSKVTQTPTCTIQIATDYLVKEKYTKEEAERTIQQLYSLHLNQGFSEEDYNRIKAKIIKNTIDE